RAGGTRSGIRQGTPGFRLSVSLDHETGDGGGGDAAGRARDVVVKRSGGALHPGIPWRRSRQGEGAAASDPHVGTSGYVAGEHGIAAGECAAQRVRPAGLRDTSAVSAGDAIEISEHGNPARLGDCRAADEDALATIFASGILSAAGDALHLSRVGRAFAEGL